MTPHSKAYLLFCNDHDWPEGGAGDLEGAYLTERQARTAFAESSKENDWGWAHILAVKSQEWLVVSTWREPRGWRDET